MKNRVHPINNNKKYSKEKSREKYEERILTFPLYAILFILFAL